MALPEEVLQTFKQKKFKKCLELIKSLKETGDVVDDFLLENCKLVCESLVVIGENDTEKIYEMQEQHYLFFEKVTSVGTISKSLPVQLKLISAFNFIFCLTFYNDVEPDLPEAEDYLESVNKVLLIVLGKQVPSEKIYNTSEKILNNLMCFKDLILCENHKTALLFIELLVVVVMYIVNVKRTLVKDCLKVVRFFVQELKHKIYSSEDEFLQLKSLKSSLFKFSLYRTAMLLSEIDSEVIDFLCLLESVFLYMSEDFKGSFNSLQNNVPSGVKTLWNYLVALNSFETGNWNLCFGFLAKTSSLVVQKNLRARLHMMQGKLNSVERNHKEALKEFERASALSPNCPTIYYYIGQEYGKIGLTDLMVENFEKIIQILHLQISEEDFQSNFETTLLDWIHPADEITEIEAYYILAVSYVLNESFKKAAENFERVLQSPNELPSGRGKRIIEMPNFLTVLHEAAVTNLQLGNLVRAEQIALDALGRYLPRKTSEKRNRQLTVFVKDIKWLQRVIRQELLEVDFASNELPNQTFYSEDLIYFFPENVVALLILCEIQRIQEVEDYKATLSKVFSMFSKYLTLMCKKDKMDEDEKHLLTLVKALAGKTCVRIASILMKQGEVSCVEKMFNRALSCNKGDRDALFNYYQVLLDSGKGKEALKLWNTFSKEEVTVGIDSVQSFSLRYLLTDKVTKRELENLQREIDSKNAELL